jgi:hypothetical protein
MALPLVPPEAQGVPESLSADHGGKVLDQHPIAPVADKLTFTVNGAK